MKGRRKRDKKENCASCLQDMDKHFSLGLICSHQYQNLRYNLSMIYILKTQAKTKWCLQIDKKNSFVHSKVKPNKFMSILSESCVWRIFYIYAQRHFLFIHDSWRVTSNHYSNLSFMNDHIIQFYVYYCRNMCWKYA